MHDELYDNESNWNCFISKQFSFCFSSNKFQRHCVTYRNVFSTIFNWLNFWWKLLASFCWKKIRTKKTSFAKKRKSNLFKIGFYTRSPRLISGELFSEKFCFPGKTFFQVEIDPLRHLVCYWSFLTSLLKLSTKGKINDFAFDQRWFATFVVVILFCKGPIFKGKNALLRLIVFEHQYSHCHRNYRTWFEILLFLD